MHLYWSLKRKLDKLFIWAMWITDLEIILAFLKTFSAFEMEYFDSSDFKFLLCFENHLLE